MKTLRPIQAGFAAVAAIFLVLVLAALGAFMVSFSNTQQLTSAQDVQGSRAYWAASAGLEWALARIPTTPALCPNSVLTQVSAASVPSPIEGFTIQVWCARNVYVENAAGPTIFQFESRAALGTVGSVGFIERSVTASLER